MEKKKYQNPTMEEIEVKHQLLTGTGDTPDSPDTGSRSVSSSFSDAE